jgi:formylglycine-generating enzyme required for sulfatase activity
MKQFLTSLAILLATFTSFAQAPNRISYQAEVRNSSNNLVINQLVGIRISILQGSNVGASVYTETHTPTTNANGLVSLQIGGGTTTGNFATINWGNGPYFLKTETDPAGGTNYSITGTNQLLSVPYALFSNSSNTSNSAANGVPVGGSEGQVLTNCGGVGIWTTGGICPGRITTLACSTATNSGTLTQGVAAASVSSIVSYSGGNGGLHNGQTVTSTGVTGLTATLTSGSFVSGAGSLTYTITGTPASSGTASFALNIGGQTCTLTRTVAGSIGTITALTCASATNSGTLTRGIAAASVSSSVPYTVGNGGTHSGQTVTSTGVTGLTATLTAGTFAIGAGSLTYTITGTPATSGTASFALNIGGKTCTLTRTVALPVGTITALSCSTATNAGTLGQGVSAASVSSNVPYTGGNGGSHTGQTVTSTGVTGLTATRTAANFATGSGTLVYTITGTPATSGTASFALNIGGQTCTLTRTVLASASITALNCSTATNNGTLGQGVAAASVSSIVSYTGGNGGYRGAQTFTSTGVTGLTATCAAGTLANGSGNLTFTITGTPATSGIASFALNIGGQTCTLNRTVLTSASITALSCSTATNNGTLTQGIAAASVNSSVPYTGGNGGYRGSQTFTSTGVTGLTATCAAGTLATGAGSLTFTITGTPASNGTASFALNIGGQTCTLTRTVNPPAGTITALTCSTATNTGTLTQGIAATIVSSSVPYTGGNGGTYTAQTITSTGVTGLTASLTAGTLLSGAGSLTYTITGTPATSGTASFALSVGGQTCNLTLTVNTSGSGPLNIETALIPAGTFTMGSPTTEPQRGTDEVQHQVTLSAYRMSKYETSNAQFAAFLNAKSIGSNGLYALGAFPTQVLIYADATYGLTWTGSQWQPVAGKENFPVVNVTWYGATEFATYAGGRLPTEAEWEYACRGNTTTAFSTGACLNNTQANYRWDFPLTGCSNTSTAYPNQTQAINSYSPNAFGLYNMHGNVEEWCSDWYGTYSTAAQTNPTGASIVAYRVIRGGSWYRSARDCRSADRYRSIPDSYFIYSTVGFRLSFAP